MTVFRVSILCSVLQIALCCKLYCEHMAPFLLMVSKPNLSNSRKGVLGDLQMVYTHASLKSDIFLKTEWEKKKKKKSNMGLETRSFSTIRSVYWGDLRDVVLHFNH